MKSNIKTVCGLEKYEELSKRKGFLNQLRFYYFVLIASLRDIGKEALSSPHRMEPLGHLGLLVHQTHSGE